MMRRIQPKCFILFFPIWLISAVSHSQSLGTPSAYDISATSDISGVTRGVQVDVQRSTGKVVYVWVDTMNTTSQKEIYCQIYDQNMANPSVRFRVNSSTTYAQHLPTVKVHQTDNSFAVSWGMYQSDGFVDVYVKKISFTENYDSVKYKSELLVNDTLTTGHQYSPVLAFDYSRDELIIGFRDDSGEDGNGTGAFFRRMNYSSTNLTSSDYIGGLVQINQSTTGTQFITGLKKSPVTGDLIAIYWSGSTNAYDAYVRAFTYSNLTDTYTPLDEVRVNFGYTTNEQDPLSLELNSLTGDYCVTYYSKGQDAASSWGVYSKFYNKSHTVIKSEFQVSNNTAGDQFMPQAVWDEENNIIIYFYMFYNSSTATTGMRYRIFNTTGSYSAVANEVDAFNGDGENLQNTFGRGIYSAFNPVNKKIYLAYDNYNWTGYSIGRARMYQYSHPNIYTPTIVYSELKDELDGSYTRTIDNKLYFKYIEKYNQGSTGTNLNYKIYDYKRTVLATATKTKYYGPNFFEVDLEGIAQFGNGGGDNYYILEVINDKGEVKYLRFKYVLEY